MEFAHQLSFRPDFKNTAEVPSFTLRTALSAIPLVSDRCGVDVQCIQERSPQTFPNSKELSVWMTFGFLSGSRNFCKLLWVFCEVLFLHGYAWIHWVAGSCTTTAHMIVSRLAIVAQDLVVCCNQVTEIYSSRYGFAIASSAWGPCNFGPFTDLTISVFR